MKLQGTRNEYKSRVQNLYKADITYRVNAPKYILISINLPLFLKIIMYGATVPYDRWFIQITT